MPPASSLTAPLRTRRCPQCSIRSISTTAPRQAFGPEHPRYIDVPEPPQQTIPDRPFPKGRLPVPRDIFRDARGLDQATREGVAGRTLSPKQKEDRLAKPRPGSRAEWRDKISADRRRNLQEGLASLRQRRIRDTARQNAIQRRRFEEREALLNAPIREDERLTAPSHGMDLVHPPNQPYNVRLRQVQLSQEEIAERYNHKTLLAHAHAQLKSSQRLASLQELYTNARSFIVNQAQLDAAIEKEFGTDENPRDFLKHDNNNLSEDDNENRASVQFSRTAMGGAGGYAETNVERIRKIGEALTGGKMGSADEKTHPQSRTEQASVAMVDLSKHFQGDHPPGWPTAQASPAQAPAAQSKSEKQAAQEWLRSDLKQQIERLAWANESDLSAGALITMAVMSSNEESVHRADIVAWIIGNSQRHASHAGAVISEAIREFKSIRFTYKGFMEDDNDFRSYEMPLEDVGNSPADSWDSDKGRILPHRARAYLMSFAKHPPDDQATKTGFRFLDLPPELRIRVYGLVFSFPTIVFDKRSVACYNRWGGYTQTRLHVQRRPWSANDLYCNERGPIKKRRSLQTRPLSQILSLLCVSKFLYREAVPYFYSMNHFRLVGFKDFSVFTRVLPPSRLIHIRSISISYMPEGMKAFNLKQLKHTITLLHLHPGFKRIEVRIDCEEDWFDIKIKDGRRQYFLAADLPGLEEMIKIFRKAEELVFVGECVKVESYALASLRLEIEGLVDKANRNAAIEPPFSAGEMVVMAVICFWLAILKQPGAALFAFLIFPRMRIQHLTCISLEFVTQETDVAIWAKAMRAMAAIKQIKKLRISARDPHPYWAKKLVWVYGEGHNLNEDDEEAEDQNEDEDDKDHTDDGRKPGYKEIRRHLQEEMARIEAKEDAAKQRSGPALPGLSQDHEQS
ncbi:hypothetical protein Tdes44962_MAKER03314 [Teratosphaeria destructans]|uniref:DUF7730 domain-containing protein n=1 Tax=Teratosphaeria destructans TaxID=418781 RepID=A0A9W7SQQ4_9PEZI|nr:hypothetical protein Tdes44962_MAKER03314 [Teratosphaeria destructans]